MAAKAPPPPSEDDNESKLKSAIGDNNKVQNNANAKGKENNTAEKTFNADISKGSDMKNASQNKSLKNGASDKAAKHKMLLKKVEQYKDIISKGCGNWRCTHPYCHSNSHITKQSYSEKELSAKVLELLKNRINVCSHYPLREITPLRYSSIQKLDAKHELDEKSPEYIEKFAIIADAFRHWDVFEVSLQTGPVTESDPAINLNEWDLIVDVIQSREELCEEACELLDEGLNEYARVCGAKPNRLQLRTLLIMLENPFVLSEDPMCYSRLLKLFSIFTFLGEENQKTLSKWLSTYKDVMRLSQILNCLQQFLTIKILDIEEDISDLTNTWSQQYPVDSDDHEEKEAALDKIRDKQTEKRDGCMVESIMLVVKVIDIVWKANQIIIADSAEIDSNGLTPKLISPALRSTSLPLGSVPELNSMDLDPPPSQATDEAVTTTAAAAADEDIVMTEAAETDEKQSTADDANNKIEIMDSRESKEESKTDDSHHRLSITGISRQRIPLPLDLFHNSGINETLCEKDAQRIIIHQHDFWHWKNNSSFSFLQYPYLLDAASKSRYLEYENMYRQNAARREQMMNLLFGALNRIDRRELVERLDLVLRVRRTHLIEDTLTLLQCYQPIELKRRLRIIFDGEQGIDQGGLTKEFFQLIVKELFDVKYGMFSHNDATGYYWFNRDALETGNEYKLIGVLMGIAIYNNAILDFRFPKVIFKKLLKQPIDFDDFRDFDPEMAKGFEQLLSFDGDVENTYCRTFSVKYQYFGIEKEDELKENGATIPLTNENREEYVDAYVRYLLSDSIKNQFQTFLDGFKQVCSSTLFDTFTPTELELLVCGATEFDFDALEGSTRYEDGFSSHSRVVKEFWTIAHSFSEFNKRKLLAFCTGSDRVPIKGLAEISLTISKNGNDDSKLPTSHTCFNHLLLPEYSSTDVLKQRLLTAIQNSEGFGLL